MDTEMLNKLGPLAPLAGCWQGAEGIDVAPGRDGAVETAYREQITFEPMGPVENGPQTLYGLRYRMVAWPLDADDPFHEESGYWLWDGDAKQVMRCFMVPRGVTILAGGSASAENRTLTMTAEAGSGTFGVLSNPFLDRAFKTVRYELTMELADDEFSYAEDTQLQIAGCDEIFHHTDRNRLQRIAA